MPSLARILVYPVKSMGPVSVQEARILRSGALEGDRTFALFDEEEKFVNGKRNALINQLRVAYNPLRRTLRLGCASSGLNGEFHVDHQRETMEVWLSEFFGIPVKFKENTQVGFPDDLDSPGPTIISTATLGEVASWFPPLDTAQLRLRIRANIEIDQVPPFWEDQMYGPKGMRVRFRIGDVIFHGNNPCQRCVVPPRDPFTGENYPEFGKTFARRRQETLPDWAEKSRFNHFYRLAINTLVPESQAGKVVRVGDEVEILELISADAQAVATASSL